MKIRIRQTQERFYQWAAPPHSHPKLAPSHAKFSIFLHSALKKFPQFGKYVIWGKKLSVTHSEKKDCESFSDLIQTGLYNWV